MIPASAPRFAVMRMWLYRSNIARLICPINASMTLPAPDVNGNQITGFDVSVPANFSGNLVLTATSPAGAFPPGATLTMTYYQYPSLDSELEMSTAGAFTIARGTHADPLLVAATLVQLGECTIIVK